jgi:hypothetical protein
MKGVQGNNEVPERERVVPTTRNVRRGGVNKGSMSMSHKGEPLDFNYK